MCMEIRPVGKRAVKQIAPEFVVLYARSLPVKRIPVDFRFKRNQRNVAPRKRDRYRTPGRRSIDLVACERHWTPCAVSRKLFALALLCGLFRRSCLLYLRFCWLGFYSGLR